MGNYFPALLKSGFPQELVTNTASLVLIAVLLLSIAFTLPKLRFLATRHKSTCFTDAVLAGPPTLRTLPWGESTGACSCKNKVTKGGFSSYGLTFCVKLIH